MSPVWIVPVVTITLTQVAVIATSIYLHRALAHRALHLHPVVDVAFRVVLWLTTGQSRQEWVAVHRKHHTFTDREGDPHSPQLLGFWRVQLFNVYYYAREARKSDTLRRPRCWSIIHRCTSSMDLKCGCWMVWKGRPCFWQMP